MYKLKIFRKIDKLILTKENILNIFNVDTDSETHINSNFL